MRWNHAAASAAIGIALSLTAAATVGTATPALRAQGGGADCNNNGIPDDQEIAQGLATDCNANGIPDDCDIADGTSGDCDGDGLPDECPTCPPVEVVFIMDTSGSMFDEGGALCGSIDQVVADLQANGIETYADFLGITGDSSSNFPCLTGSVLQEFGSLIPGTGGQLDHLEDWGAATAIVAQNYPWTPGAVRVIVPMSDEGAENGDPCEDPGPDRDAVTNAIVIANANSAVVSPIGGTGTDTCVFGLMTDLANATGGTAFLTTDPDADLAGAIYDLVLAACELFDDCNDNGIPDECEPDCNQNGIPDDCDIDDGTSEDCNGNEIPDECDIADGTSQDCNGNGIPDECETDCNGNGIADECELDEDCNGNGVLDECELDPDCNSNGIPDECEDDCNQNAVPDDCDIDDGTSIDCNGNGIPDECETGGPDCNQNGVPDECEPDCNQNNVPDDCDIDQGTSEDCNGNGIPDECEPGGDCNDNGIPDECEPDCNKNRMPDDCDIANGTSQDCNGNQVPDECDIANGTSLDCNGNGMPDECEVDCNTNGVPDDCDIASGTSQDCNGNWIPDECELDEDCNENGVPDECELGEDCNDNGVLDECEIDCNQNGVPDDCDIARGTSLDCNGNQVPDECDIADGTSTDCNGNVIPDECEPDCDEDGIPDDCGDECPPNDLNCVEFDRTEFMTARDTLTLITNFHNPGDEQGFVYAFAVDHNDQAIDFDHLTGQIIYLDGLESFEYGINAIDFRSPVGHGMLTDLDGDDNRDMNGLEYELAPGQILVPRFIGQVDFFAYGELILLGLSGGVTFDTTVDFLIYNDNEVPFSAEYTFRCWDKVRLSEISGVFGNDFLANSGDDDSEGLGSREYGWFRMDGAIASSPVISIVDPTFYAVLVERIGPYAAADLPFEICLQRGSLLPREPVGDNEDGLPTGEDCTQTLGRRKPASMLVYPEYNNRDGVLTILTMTNTNMNENTFVHFRYIGRYSNP